MSTMAPTRRLKRRNVMNDISEKYKNFVLVDVLCPICRSILIEPVTLPCNHGFCLSCFNGSVEKATLTCPLCRVRISSWLRSARKENKIVNNVLWDLIQNKFEKEVRRKLDGNDEILQEHVPIPIRLSHPGEIRREYEIQLEKERSELEKQRKSELKASELAIKQLLEDEQTAARIESEKQLLDEEIARSLAHADLAKPSCSKPKHPSLDKYLIPAKKPETQSVKNYKTTIMCQKTDAKQKQKQCKNAYKHLLLMKTLQMDERSLCDRSDSEDSIQPEMRYFKPIRVMPKSQAQGEGNIVRAPLLKVPTKHVRNSISFPIRSPSRNALVQILHHPSSPFVNCGRAIQSESPSTSTSPSIVSESGKIIKQYYNRKRNTYPSSTSVVVTPSITIVPAPFHGFESEPPNNHLRILHDLIEALTKSNDVSIPEPESIRNCNVEISMRAEKLNGFNSVVDKRMQEQLDLEFARRLHADLNNPRYRETRTKAKLKARQVTLDEFIPTKRLKRAYNI